MEHLDWIEQTSQFEEVQKKLEEHCSKLIERYFEPNNDYAIEKFLKLYSERFRYLEHLLLLQRGVAIENLTDPKTLMKMTPETVLNRQNEVKRIMLNECDRAYRFANVYLPDVKIRS
jgi:hypothetical protein